MMSVGQTAASPAASESLVGNDCCRRCETPPAASKMSDRKLWPMALEILGHQAAMAEIGLVLTAQEASSCESLPRVMIGRSTLGEQGVELSLIFGPCHDALLVGLEDLCRRCESKIVLVLDARDGSQEVCEILLLRERRELRPVVQCRY